MKNHNRSPRRPGRVPQRVRYRPARIADVRAQRTAGFTLIEMLIAVGLIVLMLTIFAQVFKATSDSVNQQRVVGDNDALARSLVRLIRSDLDRRTFRTVVPFYSGENPALQQTSFADRRGYVYIAENNPLNERDNVLQLTVRSSIPVKGEPGTPFYGRAYLSTTSKTAGSTTLINHPDTDDGRPNDGVMTSTAAEVAYFLRGTNLHRRTLLLREPLESDPTLSNPNNPTLNDGRQFYPEAGAQNHPLFAPGKPIPVMALTDCSVHSAFGFAEFHGASTEYGDFLDNSLAGLGLPQNRFGFREIGTPAEYIKDAATGANRFFGRFTVTETSFPGTADESVRGFFFPHYADFNQREDLNPYERTDLRMVGDTIDEFNPRSINLSAAQRNEMRPFDRTGEDIVMRNVTAFIIEVWDEQLGQFVRIGQTNTGKFGTAANQNSRFRSSNQPTNVFNRFDTWHPAAAIPLDIPADQRDPDAPFMPVLIDPSELSKVSQSGAVSMSSVGYRELKLWRPDTTYRRGDVIFADEPWMDQNNNGYQVGEGAVTDGDNTTKPVHGFATFFVCRQAGWTHSSPPLWKYKPGERTNENLPQGIPDPNYPNANPTVFKQPVIWEAVSNRLPLRAIRITIRFINEAHQAPRQVTMVVSLMN